MSKPRPSRTNARRTPGAAPAAVREFRIIAGEMRGRRLSYTGDPGLRPMKDRTREALFNRLRNVIAGMQVIDLFAGTGAVGLEALSRGADTLTAWEMHPATARTLQQHLQRLDLTDRATVFATDAFATLQQTHLKRLIQQRSDSPPRWCLFCCPPYEMFRTHEADLMALIGHWMAQAPAESLFVLESELQWDGQALPDADQWDCHPYAPAAIRIHWPPDPPHDGTPAS